MFENYRLISLEIRNELANSFDDLPRDPYTPGGSRRRRFCQYQLQWGNNDWEIRKLPLRPFIQPKKNNGLVGGVARYFKDIDIDLMPYIREMLRVVMPDSQIGWQVNAHLIRVDASQDEHGIPAPEGPHRDGVDYIMMLCVNRTNALGGETTIYDDNKNLILRKTLQEGDAIIIEDRKLIHDASQVGVHDRTLSAQRDMLILAIMKASYEKYGPEYETEHTGAPADLSLLPMN